MQPDQLNQPAEQPTPAVPASPPAPTPNVEATTPAAVPQAAPTPAPVEKVAAPAPVVAVSTPVDEDPEESAPQPSVAPAPAGNEPIHWQATEYIHHEKNAVWFVVFAIVALAFMLIAILLIRSITFAILIPVMAAALLVYTHRPPRILDYTLSGQGLHINDKLYPLGDYKSFGIIRDSGEFSVMLVPTKRFRPGVTVYFPEEAGEAIVDLLGARLPMQELHLDAIDRIIRKLRI